VFDSFRHGVDLPGRSAPPHLHAEFPDQASASLGFIAGFTVMMTLDNALD
jgi:hypothetical protein